MHTKQRRHRTRNADFENSNTRRREAGRPAGGLTLEVGQLLLGDILTGDHVLNDAVNGVENDLVVAQRQHRVYLSVKQAVSVNE